MDNDRMLKLCKSNDFCCVCGAKLEPAYDVDDIYDDISYFNTFITKSGEIKHLKYCTQCGLMYLK